MDWIQLLLLVVFSVAISLFKTTLHVIMAGDLVDEVYVLLAK